MEFGIVVAAGVLVLFAFLIARIRRTHRLSYIGSYQFPSRVTKRLKESYPHLRDQDVDSVLDALRDYFHICSLAKRRMVAMPSQAVDLAWHEFILFTRNYDLFCRRAIGRFLHHTPTEAMSSPTLAQEGIRRAWRLACAKDHIDPKRPTHLPLLFAIDGLLKIDDGFIYTLNCQDKSSPMYGTGYCAGHIGCASGCSGDTGGSSNGFGDSGGADGCGGD